MHNENVLCVGYQSIFYQCFITNDTSLIVVPKVFVLKMLLESVN